MWSVCSQAVGMALFLMSLALVGCVTQNNRAETSPSQGQTAVSDQIRRVDLRPRFPQRVRTEQTAGFEVGTGRGQLLRRIDAGGPGSPEAWPRCQGGPARQRSARNGRASAMEPNPISIAVTK